MYFVQRSDVFNGYAIVLGKYDVSVVMCAMD